MSLHKIRIVQVFRVQRSIVLDVEAPSPEQALFSVEDSEIDTPAHDDPRWTSDWDLKNEEITYA